MSRKMAMRIRKRRAAVGENTETNTQKTASDIRSNSGTEINNETTVKNNQKREAILGKVAARDIDELSSLPNITELEQSHSQVNMENSDKFDEIVEPFRGFPSDTATGQLCNHIKTKVTDTFEGIVEQFRGFPKDTATGQLCNQMKTKVTDTFEGIVDQFRSLPKGQAISEQSYDRMETMAKSQEIVNELSNVAVFHNQFISKITDTSEDIIDLIDLSSSLLNFPGFDQLHDQINMKTNKITDQSSNFTIITDFDQLYEEIDTETYVKFDEAVEFDRLCLNNQIDMNSNEITGDQTINLSFNQLYDQIDKESENEATKKIICNNMALIGVVDKQKNKSAESNVSPKIINKPIMAKIIHDESKNGHRYTEIKIDELKKPNEANKPKMNIITRSRVKLQYKSIEELRKDVLKTDLTVSNMIQTRSKSKLQYYKSKIEGDFKNGAVKKDQTIPNVVVLRSRSKLQDDKPKKDEELKNVVTKNDQIKSNVINNLKPVVRINRQTKKDESIRKIIDNNHLNKNLAISNDSNNIGMKNMNYNIQTRQKSKILLGKQKNDQGLDIVMKNDNAKKVPGLKLTHRTKEQMEENRELGEITANNDSKKDDDIEIMQKSMIPLDEPKMKKFDVRIGPNIKPVDKSKTQMKLDREINETKVIIGLKKDFAITNKSSSLEMLITDNITQKTKIQIDKPNMDKRLVVLMKRVDVRKELAVSKVINNLKPIDKMKRKIEEAEKLDMLTDTNELKRDFVESDESSDLNIENMNNDVQIMKKCRVQLVKLERLDTVMENVEDGRERTDNNSQENIGTSMGTEILKKDLAVSNEFGNLETLNMNNVKQIQTKIQTRSDTAKKNVDFKKVPIDNFEEQKENMSKTGTTTSIKELKTKAVFYESGNIETIINTNSIIIQQNLIRSSRPSSSQQVISADSKPTTSAEARKRKSSEIFKNEKDTVRFYRNAKKRYKKGEIVHKKLETIFESPIVNKDGGADTAELIDGKKLRRKLNVQHRTDKYKMQKRKTKIRKYFGRKGSRTKPISIRKVAPESLNIP